MSRHSVFRTHRRKAAVNFVPKELTFGMLSTFQRLYSRKIPTPSFGYAFNSFFNSFQNRQSVPCAMIFLEVDLIIPSSCKRSA